MTLEGKVAVVTGAAGGIGRAVAEALAREGARLTLIDRETEAVELAAAAETVEEPLVCAADVTSAFDASRM